MKIGYIYLLTHSEDFPFLAYIGQTVNPKNRESSHLNGHSAAHNWKFRKFISKFGAKSLKFEIIWQGDSKDLGEVETEFIKNYKEKLGEDKLFNICKGGEGIDPDIARKNAQKKIDDGTHPFLMASNIEKTKKRNKENLENGTHPFSPQFRNEINKKRRDNGNDRFVGNTFSKDTMEKRIESGIPYIIGSNNELSIIFWNIQELKDYGFNYTHVISVCKGRLKTHKGFKFIYHPKYKQRVFCNKSIC